MQTDYVFDYSESEIERIRRRAEMLRPITQRLLVSAGPGKGMRVLDIGCGAGDVTMLVADLVGPTGHVVGIDRDEAVIGAALLQTAFRQMGTAADAGGRLVQLFADAGLPAPHLFAETIVESGADQMLLPWFTATLREVLPRLAASGVVSEDEIEIDTLTERLRRAAVESRSQIEFVPRCAPGLASDGQPPGPAWTPRRWRAATD